MVGQMVHIKEDAPRSKRRMGKIVQLIESRGNEIRAAGVLLPNGNTIKRPINLFQRLETAAADTIAQNVEDNAKRKTDKTTYLQNKNQKEKQPLLPNVDRRHCSMRKLVLLFGVWNVTKIVKSST